MDALCVNFPDRAGARIDLVNVSRVRGGAYEGDVDRPTVMRTMAEIGQKLWGDRRTILYACDDPPGDMMALVWLSHHDPVKDDAAHGSHAFLAFCGDHHGLDVVGVLQRFIDRRGLMWANVAEDFEI
jgi:hypothetical protein